MKFLMHFMIRKNSLTKKLLSLRISEKKHIKLNNILNSDRKKTIRLKWMYFLGKKKV